MSDFVKHYDSPGVAEAALRRSVALRAAGLPTPAVLGWSGSAALCFERIEGEPGSQLIDGELIDLLSVVAQLHRAPVEGLPPYDPFLRIRPRRMVPTALPVTEILSEPVPVGHATLHGDLHAGQFIRRSGARVWVVDLDDLATGPPEADIANLTAHLATSRSSEGIGVWSERVCTVWSQVGDPVEPDLFTRFLRFALLRRHLKLREARRPDFEAEISAYLRASSNFSIL
jgi:hypothetical protein